MFSAPAWKGSCCSNVSFTSFFVFNLINCCGFIFIIVLFSTQRSLLCALFTIALDVLSTLFFVLFTIALIFFFFFFFFFFFRVQPLAGTLYNLPSIQDNRFSSYKKLLCRRFLLAAFCTNFCFHCYPNSLNECRMERQLKPQFSLKSSFAI